MTSLSWENILNQSWSILDSVLDDNGAHFGGPSTSSNVGDGLKADSPTTKLPLDETGIYGFCPQMDPFILAKCNRCSRLIKLQSLESHYNHRHSKLTSATAQRKELPLRNCTELPCSSTASTLTGSKSSSSLRNHQTASATSKRTPALSCAATADISSPQVSSTQDNTTEEFSGNIFDKFYSASITVGPKPGLVAGPERGSGTLKKTESQSSVAVTLSTKSSQALAQNHKSSRPASASSDNVLFSATKIGQLPKESVKRDQDSDSENEEVLTQQQKPRVKLKHAKVVLDQASTHIDAAQRNLLEKNSNNKKSKKSSSSSSKSMQKVLLPNVARPHSTELKAMPSPGCQLVGDLKIRINIPTALNSSASVNEGHSSKSMTKSQSYSSLDSAPNVSYSNNHSYNDSSSIKQSGLHVSQSLVSFPQQQNNRANADTSTTARVRTKAQQKIMDTSCAGITVHVSPTYATAQKQMTEVSLSMRHADMQNAAVEQDVVADAMDVEKVDEEQRMRERINLIKEDLLNVDDFSDLLGPALVSDDPLITTCQYDASSSQYFLDADLNALTDSLSSGDFLLDSTLVNASNVRSSSMQLSSSAFLAAIDAMDVKSAVSVTNKNSSANVVIDNATAFNNSGDRFLVTAENDVKQQQLLAKGPRLDVSFEDMKPSSSNNSNSLNYVAASANSDSNNNSHPRPAAIDDFEARPLGSGIHVFTREYDAVRCAIKGSTDERREPPTVKLEPVQLENCSEQNSNNRQSHLVEHVATRLPERKPIINASISHHNYFNPNGCVLSLRECSSPGYRGCRRGLAKQSFKATAYPSSMVHVISGELKHQQSVSSYLSRTDPGRTGIAGVTVKAADDFQDMTSAHQNAVAPPKLERIDALDVGAHEFVAPDSWTSGHRYSAVPRINQSTKQTRSERNSPHAPTSVQLLTYSASLSAPTSPCNNNNAVAYHQPPPYAAVVNAARTPPYSSSSSPPSTSSTVPSLQQRTVYQDISFNDFQHHYHQTSSADTSVTVDSVLLSAASAKRTYTSSNALETPVLQQYYANNSSNSGSGVFSGASQHNAAVSGSSFSAEPSEKRHKPIANIISRPRIAAVSTARSTAVAQFSAPNNASSAQGSSIASMPANRYAPGYTVEYSALRSPTIGVAPQKSSRTPLLLAPKALNTASNIVVNPTVISIAPAFNTSSSGSGSVAPLVQHRGIRVTPTPGVFEDPGPQGGGGVHNPQQQLQPFSSQSHPQLAAALSASNTVGNSQLSPNPGVVSNGFISIVPKETFGGSFLSLHSRDHSADQSSNVHSKIVQHSRTAEVIHSRSSETPNCVIIHEPLFLNNNYNRRPSLPNSLATGVWRPIRTGTGSIVTSPPVPVANRQQPQRFQDGPSDTVATDGGYSVNTVARGRGYNCYSSATQPT